MTLTYEDIKNLYRDEKGNIPNFFYIVKKDLEILDNPKADLLMSVAWADSHAYGYHEVYQKACDLVGLIR